MNAKPEYSYSTSRPSVGINIPWIVVGILTIVAFILLVTLLVRENERDDVVCYANEQFFLQIQSASTLIGTVLHLNIRIEIPENGTIPVDVALHYWKNDTVVLPLCGGAAEWSCLALEAQSCSTPSCGIMSAALRPADKRLISNFRRHPNAYTAVFNGGNIVIAGPSICRLAA